MSDKSTQAFIDATRNPYEANQNAGMKYLHDNNSGVEAVALTYKHLEGLTGKSLVNEASQPYHTLNAMAHHRSDTPAQEPSTLANEKAAAETLKQDPKTTEQQLEDILSGRINARSDLIRTASEILNKNNRVADVMLERLTEINPGLGKRMEGIRNTEDKKEQGKATLDFIKEIMDGKHDYFQKSQAGYNFKQLADMGIGNPEFPEKYNRAVNNYPPLGNYLANYVVETNKQVVEAASKGQTPDLATIKNGLQTQYTMDILAGKETKLTPETVHALDVQNQAAQFEAKHLAPELR